MDGERLQLPFVQWFSSMNSVSVLLSGWLTWRNKIVRFLGCMYIKLHTQIVRIVSVFDLLRFSHFSTPHIVVVVVSFFSAYIFCCCSFIWFSLPLSQLVLNIVITNIISLFVPGIFMYHRVLFAVYLAWACWFFVLFSVGFNFHLFDLFSFIDCILNWVLCFDVEKYCTHLNIVHGIPCC